MNIRTIQETGKLIAQNISRFLDHPVRLSADGWLSTVAPISVLFEAIDLESSMLIQFSIPLEDVQVLARISEDQLMIESLKLPESLRQAKTEIEEMD